jgi:hypothetical protein
MCQLSLALISANLPGNLFIDVFSRADRDNLHSQTDEPINDSTSSHSQTAIALKRLFERLSARRLLEYVG